MAEIRRLSPEVRDRLCRGILPELATYLHVIERGTKTAAAETFGISVPGVVERLRRLEDLLGATLKGAPLLQQTEKKRLVPTEAGRIVMYFAQAVMARTEQFLHDLSDTQSADYITVYADMNVWFAYGPAIEAEYEKRVPDGRIQSTAIDGDRDLDKLASRVARAVHDDDYDIGLTGYPVYIPPPFVCRRLADSELVIVFNSGYPYLPPAGTRVNVLDLFRNDPDLTFSSLSRYKAGALSNRVFAYLNRTKAPILHSQLREYDNVFDIRISIKGSAHTISILPSFCIPPPHAKKLITYRLDPAPKPWPCGLLYMPNSSRPAVHRFIQCIDHLFQKPSSVSARKKS
jgi:DNA-binding transcriptional LysR family regulator